jgi:polyphosphate kinase 2
MGKSDDYEDALEALQVQLVTTQAWTIETGVKTLIVLEGRDSAGKDGAIKRITEFMAPRQTRVVALPKPTERETSQWYFQRYVPHLPAGGETIILNRSWYNRGGVEPVMGFCTPEQHAAFLKDAPRFEKMLVGSDLKLIKLWLDISKDEQAKRLAERATDPLKRFKVSGNSPWAFDPKRLSDFPNRRRVTLFLNRSAHVIQHLFLSLGEHRG